MCILSFREEGRREEIPKIGKLSAALEPVWLINVYIYAYAKLYCNEITNRRMKNRCVCARVYEWAGSAMYINLACARPDFASARPDSPPIYSTYA